MTLRHFYTQLPHMTTRGQQRTQRWHNDHFVQPLSSALQIPHPSSLHPFVNFGLMGWGVGGASFSMGQTALFQNKENHSFLLMKFLGKNNFIGKTNYSKFTRCIFVNFNMGLLSQRFFTILYTHIRLQPLVLRAFPVRSLTELFYHWPLQPPFFF